MVISLFMNRIWVRSSLCLVASLAQLLLKNALKLTFKKGPRIRAYFRMQWQQYSVHGVGGSKFCLQFQKILKLWCLAEFIGIFSIY